MRFCSASGVRVDHHHFVDSLQHPIRHRFPHLDPRDSLHRRGHALQMLNVHGGENVDPRIEQLEYVFIAFAMLAAFDVGVRQFVHQRDAGLARENGVHVHLFEERAFILDRFARHHFQIRDQFPDRLSSVGFHDSDHHIFAASVPPDRLGEHGVGLAHAGSISKKELEPACSSWSANILPATARGSWSSRLLSLRDRKVSRKVEVRGQIAEVKIPVRGGCVQQRILTSVI